MEKTHHKLNLEELEKHFWYIASMVRGDISLYDRDAILYIFSIIFLKRVCDISVREFDMPGLPELGKHLWQNLRNMAVHSMPETLAESLKEIFSNFDKSNSKLKDVFSRIDFNRCKFMTSIRSIILYLNDLSFSFENISTDIMGKAFSNLIHKLLSSNINFYDVPPDLMKFIIKILDISPNELLYNPTIKTGNFFLNVA